MTRERLILCNDREGIDGILPCFLFEHHNKIGLFVIGKGLVKCSLIGDNMFKISYNIFILLV